jgi:hypothetical protein
MIAAFALAASLLQAQPAPDYSTLDGTIKALYAAVSGPAGPRDWDKFKALFPEKGILGAVLRAQDGTRRVVEMTPDSYIERNKPAFERSAFYEGEIHRKAEQFGDIANVWSTYAARREPEGEVFMRGINTIQMRFDGKRWWIVSLLWQAETADNPLPKQYLPGGSKVLDPRP